MAISAAVAIGSEHISTCFCGVSAYMYLGRSYYLRWYYSADFYYLTKHPSTHHRFCLIFYHA
jgi:hypothetical protein